MHDVRLAWHGILVARAGLKTEAHSADEVSGRHFQAALLERQNKIPIVDANTIITTLNECWHPAKWFVENDRTAYSDLFHIGRNDAEIAWDALSDEEREKDSDFEKLKPEFDPQKWEFFQRPGEVHDLKQRLFETYQNKDEIKDYLAWLTPEPSETNFLKEAFDKALNETIQTSGTAKKWRGGLVDFYKIDLAVYQFQEAFLFNSVHCPQTEDASYNKYDPKKAFETSAIRNEEAIEGGAGEEIRNIDRWACHALYCCHGLVQLRDTQFRVMAELDVQMQKYINHRKAYINYFNKIFTGGLMTIAPMNHFENLFQKTKLWAWRMG